MGGADLGASVHVFAHTTIEVWGESRKLRAPFRPYSLSDKTGGRGPITGDYPAGGEIEVVSISGEPETWGGCRKL